MNLRQKCILCESKNLELLFESQRYPFMGIYLVSPETSICLRPIRIMGCKRCGHIQHGFDFVENDLNILYAKKYNPNIFLSEHLAIDDNDPLIKAVLQFYPDKEEKVRILDIGCGKAERIDFLNNKQIEQIEAYGVDPGLPLNRESNRLIRSYFKQNIFNKKFHIIFHNNVLEHINEPINFLKSIHQSLESGGVQIFRLPNEKKFFNLLHIGRFVHDHISYFTPQQVQRLVESTGFQILKSEVSDLYYTLIVAQKVDGLHKGWHYQPQAETIPDYFDLYRESIHKINRSLKDLRSFCKGKKVALYGACHLCYFVMNGLVEKDQIALILDRNRAGLYLLGFDFKITDELDKLDQVDIVIITSQNAQEEILQTILKHPRRPSHCITLFPLPEVHEC